MKGETIIAFSSVVVILIFLLMAGNDDGSGLESEKRIELGRNYLVISILLGVLIALTAYNVY